MTKIKRPRAKLSKLKLSPSIQLVFAQAKKAYQNAYAPYSKFTVGAAFQSGRQIYSGCNVENASYGASICAERTAVCKAISEGSKKIENLVVLTPTRTGAVPCALCLQVLSEFCSADLIIWIGNLNGLYHQMKFKDLLSSPFQKKDLENRSDRQVL